MSSRRREDAITSLFLQEWRSLSGMAAVLLGEKAAGEDVVMDAFVKVYSGWRSFSKVERQTAYIRRVVINMCRSQLRRRKLDQRIRQSEALEGRFPQGFELDQSFEVWRFVALLPYRQRLMVVLRYIADLTEEQIAFELGCSKGAVKSQLSKARSKLRDHLNEDHYQEV